ncbi:hypothetical protein CHS0354_013123 [Potamilus streckersoni]|uniref:Multicopper oxidase n=1 Tax=Potamilus streckersoni TaxID=2493646 RepID=A0AAE0S6J6_9BIVA|nr:hypothetical protein CHS0354_013123 [Potamilus streckersoni]
MDGVVNLTQKPIVPNSSFVYKYTPPDAGTFWYHPHNNSLGQIGRGLFGVLIVKEPVPYDADEDAIVMLNDWNLKGNGQIDTNFESMMTMSHAGRIGNTTAVNSANSPVLTFAPGSRVRLRFINGATARIFIPDIPASLNPYMIAADAYPIPPVPYKSWVLGPGMRMDVVIDLPETEGGAMSGMMGGGGMGMMRGMMGGMMSGVFWQINGHSMAEDHDYEKPIFSLKKDKSYILNIVNETAFDHPIHMHGHTFRVVSADGKKLSRSYLTDTVYVPSGTRREIAFVADNPGRWMIHCHIIDHQVSGMMGFFEV